MRSTFRLLASVKPGRFLEPGSPTGLTGLFNHPAPRSTLIYLYSATLEKLKALPDTSVYRQSAEALTQHRLKIVEAVKAEGYDAWAERANKKIAEHPEVFNTPEGGVAHEEGKHIQVVRHGRSFVSTRLKDEPDERLEEWDGEEVGAPELEGTRTTEERAGQKVVGMKRPGSDEKTVTWEQEPPLEASQYVG
jgi:NADH dehydrogenase (ubiquinone) 1 alpha subcomplex subunit 5